MVNNVIGVVNYVIAARPSLLNFMIADSIGAGRGPLVTVPAQELSHLGLQRSLHQQLGTEAGDLLQDLRQ
jgi:hypothetical protein